MPGVPADVQEPGQPDSPHGSASRGDNLQGVWKGSVASGKPEETPCQSARCRYAASTTASYNARGSFAH